MGSASGGRRCYAAATFTGGGSAVDRALAVGDYVRVDVGFRGLVEGHAFQCLELLSGANDTFVGGCALDGRSRLTNFAAISVCLRPPACMIEVLPVSVQRANDLDGADLLLGGVLHGIDAVKDLLQNDVQLLISFFGQFAVSDNVVDVLLHAHRQRLIFCGWERVLMDR